jgi:hypothetical protein
VLLTCLPVPDDGSAELKHVVYWHNFRMNGIVCEQIHTVVCQTVFFIIVIQYTPLYPVSVIFSSALFSPLRLGLPSGYVLCFFLITSYPKARS